MPADKLYYRVKPLAWEASPDNPEVCQAKAPFAWTFTVGRARDGRLRRTYCFHKYSDEGSCPCATEEAGKAAAEKLYRERIAEALEEAV